MKSAAAKTDLPLVLSLDELMDYLRVDPARDPISVALATPCLVVALSEADELCSEDRSVLRAGLAQLAAPALGLMPGPVAAPVQEISDCFDALASDEQALALLVEACARRPLASLALVQLLRQAERLTIHEGLVAESWVYSMLQAGPEFAEWLAERGDPALGRRVFSGPAVTMDRHLDRLRITLSRPEKRNAFSVEMRDGLCEAMAVACSDPSIGEVVIEGAGESFCSGGDLDEFGSFPDPATAHALRSTRNAGRMISGVAARVRAEVHGACVGAGVELPAFAARVVAHPDAFFQLPEVGMGLVPGAGGTVSIPRRIGRQRTAWMALTGERVDAATALSWNLVDELRDVAPMGESR